MMKTGAPEPLAAGAATPLTLDWVAIVATSACSSGTGSGIVLVTSSNTRWGYVGHGRFGDDLVAAQ